MVAQYLRLILLVGLLASTGCVAPIIQSPAAPAPYPTAAQADVDFLTGMIHHHSQAIVMSELAEARGANQAIQTLAGRIIVSQRDEIALMELWLRDHGIEPPDVGSSEHAHSSPMMPGMATPAQIAALSDATGADFDRLFLTYMIRHHEGALEMVDHLYSIDGGGVDDTIYKFASDTFADQGSEIDRMERMLEAMPPQR